MATAEDVKVKRYQLYIDGGFVDAADGASLDSTNPTIGEGWYSFAHAGHADVDRAVTAAQRAFEEPSWREMSPVERGRLLRRIAEVAAEIGPELARIETTDNGKLIREMEAQHRQIPSFWEYFAGWPDKLDSAVLPAERASTLNYCRREPIGVVALIVPWNSPMLVTTYKLAPALAAGNTVVVKPSEHTSASVLEFVRALEEAGLPPGVVNVVTGLGETTGEALTGHPGLDLISFTGGTETGRRVAEVAASRPIPALMELGGKSPNIVFEDADLHNASMGIVAGIFAAAGQSCVAGSRVFVQRSVYEDVLERVTNRAQGIRLGDPSSDETDVGPIAFQEQMEKVLSYVDLGRQEGATLLLGGERSKDPDLERGFFVEPTIFGAVENHMRVAREEIFGPIACFVPFDTEDEVVRMANDTPYGLAAGVWTNDLARAHTVAHQLHAGTVWVNTYRSQSALSPTGGFKESGYGKENGPHVMLEYTRVKSVWVNLSREPASDPFIINP